MKQKIIFKTFLLLIFLLISGFLKYNPSASQFRTHEEHFLLSEFAGVRDSDQLFSTASVCKQCHGPDIASDALKDEKGNDVNMYDQWKTTMMANSARDPYWKAKIDHEKSINPNMMMRVMESECTHCHAPLGQFLAYTNGEEYYTFETLDNDSLGIDGVNCSACHQISPEISYSSFSGKIHYDTTRTTYGPYDNDFAALMEDYTGFRPEYSAHINQSLICAGCHTLITNTLDLDGIPTGTQYVEQATYHEWLNSKYPEEGTSCQDCHMPRINDEVVISSQPAGLPPRSPFGLHTLVGSNSFMLELMKNNKEVLGIDAKDIEFDASISQTNKMLKNNSVNLKSNITGLSEGSVTVDVIIENKTGHKLPSGFLARRMFLEVKATVLGKGPIFHSGKMDSEYYIINEDPLLEEHHNIIANESQVQIYEAIAVDITGLPTDLLKTAVRNQKDNRIPPAGFRTDHKSYDTISIRGFALSDPDFNWTENEEGSGKDIVHYNIPLKNASGLLAIEVKVNFQSIAPRWLENMFELDSEHINAFRTMYENSDNAPIVMAVSRDTVMLPNRIASLSNAEEIKLYPNPTSDWIVVEGGNRITSITIRSLAGKTVWSGDQLNQQIFLPEKPGIYIVEIISENEEKTIHKVLRQ